MRESFSFALKHFKITKAVEIGVYEGENAVSMLRQGIDFLYLIDPYIAYTNHSIATDLPTFKVSQEDMTRAKELMLNRISVYEGKFKLLEMTSEEASKSFEDDSIDYAHVDAIHNYDCVKKDFDIWFPKIRPGGVLGGHDYVFGYNGLMRAVYESARLKRVVLQSFGADWWVVK